MGRSSAMGFVGWSLDSSTKPAQSYPSAGCVFSVLVKRVLPTTQTIRTDDSGLWPGGISNTSASIWSRHVQNYIQSSSPNVLQPSPSHTTQVHSWNSMFSHPSVTMQELRRLDTSSPIFQYQLSDFLDGEEYVRYASGLKGDDLVWLIDYLDEVRHCATLFRMLFVQIGLGSQSPRFF